MSPPTPKSLNAAKLVLAAIGDLHDNGASKNEIAEYIENEFAVPNKDIGQYLSRAIENGIAFGAIKRQRGRYYLGEAIDGIREHRRRRRKSGSKGRRRRRRRRRS